MRWRRCSGSERKAESDPGGARRPHLEVRYDQICYADTEPPRVAGGKRSGTTGHRRPAWCTGRPDCTFEPLSDLPRRALDRTAEAFPVIAEVNHPNVKLCFDIYHLQRTEGNIVVNLRKGLSDSRSCRLATYRAGSSRALVRSTTHSSSRNCGGSVIRVGSTRRWVHQARPITPWMSHASCPLRTDDIGHA